MSVIPVLAFPDPMDVSQPGDNLTVIVGPNAPNHARSLVPQALSPNNTEGSITATLTSMVLSSHVIKVIQHVTHQSKGNRDVRENGDIADHTGIHLFRVTRQDRIIRTNEVEQSTIPKSNTNLTLSPIDI